MKKTTTTIDVYDFGLHEKLEAEEGRIFFRCQSGRHETSIEFLKLICRSAIELGPKVALGEFGSESVIYREKYDEFPGAVRTIKAEWIADVVYIEAFFYDDYFAHVTLTTHIVNAFNNDKSKHWSTFSRFKGCVDSLATKM